MQEIIKALFEGEAPVVTQERVQRADVELRGLVIGAGDPEQVAGFEASLLNDIKLAQETQAAVNASKAGAANLTLPELSFGQRLKRAATSPLIELAIAAEMAQSYWSHPFAAAVLLETQRLEKQLSLPITEAVKMSFGVPAGHKLLNFSNADFDELETRFQEHNRTQNRWKAYSEAFDDWEANWAVKLAYEIGLDPLTYIGFGFTSKIIKPLPWVGPRLAAFNTGYATFMDDAFRTAFSIPSRVFPQTIAQKANIVGAQVTGVLRKFAKFALDSSEAELLTKFGGQKLSTSLHAIIKLIGTEPLLSNSPAWDVLNLLQQASERSVINPSKIADWATLLGSDIITKTDDILLHQFEDIQKIFDLAKGRSGADPGFVDIAASKLIDVVAPGNAQNKQVLALAKQEIVEAIQSLKDDLVRLTTPFDDETGRDMIFRLGRSVTESQGNILRIPTQRLNINKVLGHSYQGGVVNSMFSGVDAFTRVVWTNSIEKHVWIPAARSVLTFGMYGPWNVLEGIIKPALEGINPFGTFRFYAGRLGFVSNKVSPAGLQHLDVTGLPNTIDELANVSGSFIENLGREKRFLVI